MGNRVFVALGVSIYLLAIIFCLVDLSTVPVLAQANQHYKIERCIDGDTVILEGGERLRMIGIDTPELHHPKKPIQYFAREAYEFCRKELGGKKVRLEYGKKPVDKYGRKLAYVYRGKFFYNEEAVRQGYGLVYNRFPHREDVNFAQIEQQARSHGAGMWKGHDIGHAAMLEFIENNPA